MKERTKRNPGREEAAGAPTAAAESRKNVLTHDFTVNLTDDTIVDPNIDISHDLVGDLTDDLTDKLTKDHTDELTDERWQAIVNNDASYDSRFLYAVSTTRIFCRPSCKSRPPKKQHVRLFLNGQEALSAGFRPCKRCKPTGERLPDAEWTAVVADYIDRHYADRLTLDALASACHGSPYHLQRTFKKVSGLSPAEYIQHRRVEAAKELLVLSDKPVTEIGASVGLPNTPYFITLFKKMTGQTPAAFRLLAQTGTLEDFK